MRLTIRNESKETVVVDFKNVLYMVLESGQGYNMYVHTNKIFDNKCVIVHNKHNNIRVYRKNFKDNYLIIIEDDSDYLYF